MEDKINNQDIVDLKEGVPRALVKITALLSKEIDDTKRDILEEQQNKLSLQLQELIDKNIPEDNEKYRAATAKMAEANTQLEKAIEGIQQLSDAINKVAAAIAAMAEVLALAA